MQSFSDIAIPASIKNALDKMKFNTPTPIQSAAIPIALEGKDVIACAATGSGKTAAFAIPAITMLINNPEKNALVLAPTRELAQQISEMFRQITDYCEGITMVSIVGGFDMHRQLSALRRKPRIIIGTPGRVTDHLRRRSLNLSNTGILILDEGDRMLDMGFAPQLDAILQFLPQKRQTMLFTATLPPKVKQLASQYLHKPQEVMVGNTSQPVDTVAQFAMSVPQEKKNVVLMDELNKRKGSIIVFARTQRRTDDLAMYLDDCGVDVTTIHGGLTQGKRNRAIQGFKRGEYRVLVATDIAARGIDVPAVEHVINFDLPLMDEDYVHRIGRTGRNGAKGEALSFVSNHEFGLWAAISRKYNVHSDDVVDPRRNKGRKGRTKGSVPKAREFTRSASRDNSFYTTETLNTEIRQSRPDDTIEIGNENVVMDTAPAPQEQMAPTPKVQKGFQRSSEAFDPEDRVVQKALAEENLNLDMKDGVKIPVKTDEGFIPAERYEKRKKFGNDRFEKRERFGKGSRFNGASDRFEKPAPSFEFSEDERPRGSKPFIDSFFKDDGDQKPREEREERSPRRFNDSGPRGGSRFGDDRGKRFGGGSNGGFKPRGNFGGGDRPERGGFKPRGSFGSGDRPDRGGFGAGGGERKRFDRGGDRPERREWTPNGERSERPRFDRGANAGGDRPDRGGFKPRGSFGSGDRPERGGFNRDGFAGRDKPREGGFKPRTGFGDRGGFGGGNRPDRGGFGGGPARSFDRKPFGEKSFGAKRRDDEGSVGGGEDRPKRKNFYSKDKDRRSSFPKKEFTPSSI